MKGNNFKLLVQNWIFKMLVVLFAANTVTWKLQYRRASILLISLLVLKISKLAAKGVVAQNNALFSNATYKHIPLPLTERASVRKTKVFAIISQTIIKAWNYSFNSEFFIWKKIHCKWKLNFLNWWINYVFNPSISIYL